VFERERERERGVKGERERERLRERERERIQERELLNIQCGCGSRTIAGHIAAERTSSHARLPICATHTHTPVGVVSKQAWSVSAHQAW
jgi:hypothetical protein